MKLETSLLRVLPALGVLAAILLVPSESRATTLACDDPPIVIGNTASAVWAFRLDTSTVLWNYPLAVDAASTEQPDSVPTFGDLGQDEAGALYLITLSNPPAIWQLSGASGSAEADPGSGDAVFVGELALPGDSSADRISSNMLGFDEYGMGYVMGLTGGSGPGDPTRAVELLRFDPESASEGVITLSIVAAGLDVDGTPPRAPAGDILIAGEEAFIPLQGSEREILAIGLEDTDTSYSSTGSVRIAGSFGSFPGPGTVSGWGTAATGGKFFIAGDDGTDPAVVEFALDGGSSTFGAPITPGASASSIFGLTGNGEAVFDSCNPTGFPSSLGFSAPVTSPEPSQGSPTASVSSTPVRVAGALPSLPAGDATRNRGGTLTALTATSSAARSVTYRDGDTPSIRVTGASGTSVEAGVVADTNGQLLCEVCADLPVGSVIEVWLFSEPRLIAAHRVTDDDCQTFTVPLATPLDGGGTVATGTHTLQVALSTAAGMEAFDVGITVGGPVPTTVPAGDGPAPTPWPLGLMLAAVLACGLAAATRRTVAVRS